MDYSTYSQIRQIDNSNTRRVKDEMKTLDSIIAELDLTNDDEETKLKKGYNFVVMYKKDTIGKEMNFQIIKEDIINCFKELELYA